MTKLAGKDIAKQFTKSMKKALSSASIRGIALSLLFLFSGIGASVLINPVSAAPYAAAPSSAAPVGAAPALTQAEANWAYPNGNAFGQDYNSQNQINSSNAQYLGLSWIYPLPGLPSGLSTLFALGTSGVGVDPLIVNGTAFVITQFDQVFAFNIANGNVLWTLLSPLIANQTLPSGSGGVGIHEHDGTEAFTTATFASGVQGPTFWFQAGNDRVYAVNAITGKEEMNFTDYTGLSMVAGNNPVSTYSTIGASNIVIDSQLGLLVNSMDQGIAMNAGRQFFVAWNLNSNPPSIKWITYTTPPQPGSNVALNPNFDTQLIANMTGAETFYPGVDSTNGYTTPAEIAGGVLTNVNNDMVVNWKGLSATQLNATLYNDWGYSNQSPQCEAITGGASTGSTGAGWGGQWLVGSGQSAGTFIVSTNNKDPYVTPCNPGPDLWSAATMALNMTTGKIIWAFQANAHDIWDYDCSWSQAIANETIANVNTEVVIKTCKNGYLYELNAVTGNLIWAWSPPSGVGSQTGPARCDVCYMLNPLNKTQMNLDFPSALLNCAPAFTTACLSGPQPPFLAWPSEIAGFEDEQAYDPANNQIYATSHMVPYYEGYVPVNSSDYLGGGAGGIVTLPCATCGTIANNSTVWDINATTGQIVWHYSGAPLSFQGFRGQTDVSGNIVYTTLSSGDILMLNAKTGALVRDYYIGAPMDVGVSIGASVGGQEYILVPAGTCSLEAVTTCPGSTPGDIVALTLVGQPSTSTSVSTTTTTVVSTSTATGSGTVTTTTTTATVTSSTGGVSSAVLYGVAAVAVIFIIVSGYLAMRGRKPPA